MKCLLILLASVTFVAANRRIAANLRNGRPFWDPEFCFLYPDERFFPHENCEQFNECDEDFNMIEGWCPEGEIFDAQDLFCGDYFDCGK